MDNLNTVIGTYLLSISVILILYALSYARYSKKLKDCQDDLND
tara:strand:+ start:227 stop:355 length:129 start_codon:yes stop_codon:yes gene_type:complete